jgi:hypothetical protein
LIVGAAVLGSMSKDAAESEKRKRKLEGKAMQRSKGCRGVSEEEE